MPRSQTLKEILKSVLGSVSDTLKAPVAKTDVELDLRSQYIRTEEVFLSQPHPASRGSLFPQPDGFERLVR